MDVFLLGAGASAPLGLPITKGFLSDFSPEGNVTHIYRAILNFSKCEPKHLDIEFVFQLLDEFSKLKDSFLVHLFDTKALCPIARMSHEILACGNAINIGAEAAEKLLLQIKSFILKKLCNFSPKKAFDLFFPLFKPFIPRNKKLIIFTTNYDLVLEKAFTDNSLSLLPKWRELGFRKFYQGFEPRDRGFVFDFNQKEIFKTGRISVLKLHGSIDWRPYGDVIVLGGTDKPEDPDRPFLIYPGYKSVPDQEPFVSLHLAFLEALSKAHRLIVIGFAFRDLYINSILHHVLSLNKKLRVYALCPEFPEDSSFPALQNSFPDRVHHIQKKLESLSDEEEHPLWAEIQNLESPSSSSPSEKEKEPS